MEIVDIMNFMSNFDYDEFMRVAGEFFDLMYGNTYDD
jgi:hypothetical protein